MTIQTEDSKIIYESDGIQTDFSFAFQTDNADWISVYEDAIPTTKVFEVILEADQTVNPGGSMNYLEPPPADGVSITIVREVPLDQNTDYTAYDGFPAETHEEALDKLTMQNQQQDEQIKRAIQVPIDEPASGNLPVETPEPLHGLMWGADGASIVNSEEEIDQVTAIAQQSADDSQASADASAASAANAAIAANNAELSAEQASDEADRAATVFDSKLAGYEDTGLHTAYSSDADLILWNSGYVAWSGTTNTPVDFTTSGILFTDMVDSGTTAAVQRLVGMQGTDRYKVWIRTRQASTWDAWNLVIDPDAPPGDSFTDRLLGYNVNGLHDEFAGDLNTIVVNSGYSILGSSVANAPTDLGTERGILITEIGHTVGQGVQYLMGSTNTAQWKVWMRPYQSSAYGAWKLVVDGAAMSVRYSGFEDTGFTTQFSGDLNDILNNSFYRINVSSVTNEPSDATAWGVIRTNMLGSAATGLQTLYGMTGNDAGKIWSRSREGAVWGAWKLVVDGGAFTQRLAGYNDDGLSVQYSGDLDAIIVQANYLIFGGTVTNAPSDFSASGLGWVTTSVHKNYPTNPNRTQYLIGDSSNEHKVWMRHSAVAGTFNGAWKLVVDGGTFTHRLAGYKDDGLHEQELTDPDGILVNSAYQVFGDLINLPADFAPTGRGLLCTDFMTSANTVAVQRLYGMNQDNDWKMWMRHKDTTWGAWKLVVDGQVVSSIVANNTSASMTFSNIPADCREITLSGVNVQMPNVGATILCRWGANGSADTVNYSGRVSSIIGSTANEAASNTGYAALFDTSLGANDFTLLDITLRRIGTGNLWLMSAQCVDITGGRCAWSTVEHTADGGPLDTLSIVNTGGNFQSGTVQIRYKT